MTELDAALTDVDRSELDGRIDGFLLNRLDPDTDRFKLCQFVPVPTWNRFDLGFKLLYLDSLAGLPSEFSERIYLSHISAFSLGDMKEPGSLDKSGAQRFIGDFQTIYRSFAADGFDPDQSLIPLARDGSPLNGGHRLASAMALGKPVVGVETGLDPMVFDHVYFRTRGMPQADLCAAATRMVAAMPDAAVALIWPAAKGKDAEVERLVGPLVFKHEVTLGANGAHNLLARIYRGEPWLGDPDDNYPGIERKLVKCFSNPGPVRMMIFDAPPSVDRIALKERIRAIFGIGKDSVHITDTHAEAIEASRLLLNRNSVHFLNNARPMAFAATRKMAGALVDTMARAGMPPDVLAGDTGLVIGAYGLRPPGDIDVIADKPLTGGMADIAEQHTGRYRDCSIGDLLQDPALHFYYFDLKFISLRQVYVLKSNRAAGRDVDDLALIEPLLESSGNTDASEKILKFRILKLRVRRQLIRLLFRIGIGDQMRRIYRAVKSGPKGSGEGR